MQAKQFIEDLFKQITDNPLDQIKQFIEQIQKKIQKKEGYLKNFSDLKSLLNECKEGQGRSIIHFASSRGDIDVFDYLVSLGTDIAHLDESENNAFFVAIEHQHLPLIKHMVENHKVDPTQKRDNNVSGIHLAAMKGDLGIVDYLLSKGVNINELSSFGTPIRWAAAQQQIEMIRYFMERGADLNMKIECDIPHPLLMAVDQSNSVLTDLLLEYKADVNCRDNQGHTPLLIASEKGNLEDVKKLVEKGADTEYQLNGKTALQLAYENDHGEIVEYLKANTKIPLDETIKKKKQQIQDKEKSVKLKDEGNVYFKEKNYEKACEKYDEAISFDPTNASFYTNKAACLQELKKYKEVLEVCSLARKVDESWVKTYFREGQAYESLQEYAEAAASYWEALHKEPGNKIFKDLFEKCKLLGQEQAQKNKK